MTSHERQAIQQWRRWEQEFASARDYEHPLQEVTFEVRFDSPAGKRHLVEGFWDGGLTWRARFMPGEQGQWRYTTSCSDTSNRGLHGQSGTFDCVEPADHTRFDQHGLVRLAANRRYLAHADGTPFLFLSDTAWNGPLRSTPEEWADYLQVRVRQGFTAVQLVTTQWIAAPDGDLHGDLAYHGRERIDINSTFFGRLDAKLDAINRAGLLAAPVLLWAARWSQAESEHSVNPGVALPEDQAILLARYMVARWGGNHVLWLLNGDGDYRGAAAARWRTIGRGVFGGRNHAPVSLHPNGMNIPSEEFRDEAWLDITGYQSGHGDDDATLSWLVAGPPAQDWRLDPPRPSINLEPPYERHLSYQSRQPISPFMVRRALYWSLLVAPPAGVTYGGHGVWGWDDGTAPPVAHPTTGIPLPWRAALAMPAAQQVAHLAALFQQIDWPRLRPAPELLVHGAGEPSRFIAVASSEQCDLVVAYTPVDRVIELRIDQLTPGLAASWFNPRSGEQLPATEASVAGRFATPAAGDWLLLLTKSGAG